MIIKVKKYIKDRLDQYEFKDWHAVVLLIVLLFAIFSPLLIFQKVLLNPDATYAAYPSGYFYGHFFGSPLNNFLFSNYPVTVAFEYGYFHPLYNLFYYLFESFFAYHFLIFVHYIGASLFTFLFVRKLGLSNQAAVLSSVSYTLGQFSMAWLGVPSVANAVFLLPVVMFSMLQIAALKKWSILLLGVCLGLAFLATHYQFIVMALSMGGVFFVYEIWQGWKNNHSKKLVGKQLLFVCIGISIALVISLPQALHSLNFFSETTRVKILVYPGAPYTDILRYLLPTFEAYSATEFRPYIGIAALFFLLIALGAIYKRKIVENRAFFFACFFLITLMICFKYSPSVYIFKNIPFIKYFTDQARWIYLCNFAAVILAGFGFDYALKSNLVFPSARLAKFIKRFSVAVVTFFTVANVIIVIFGSKIVDTLQEYFDKYLYANTTRLPIEYYHNLIEVMAKKMFLNFSFNNVNIIFLVLCLIALHFILKTGQRKVLFANLIIVLTICNMLTVSASMFSVINKNLLTDTSKIAEYIHSHEKSNLDYRVFGFSVPFAQYQQINALHPEAEEESLKFAREALMGNLNVFSEIPIVAGYNPMAFRRHVNLVTFLENTVAQKTTEEKVALFLTQLPLLSVMNIKYVISPYELSSKDLKLVLSEKVTSFNVQLYLYEYVKALPRIYLAKNVSFYRENDEVGSFELLLKPGSNFNDQTQIECDVCQSAQREIDKNSSLTITQRNSSGFSALVKSSRDEWLVVSQEATPGWVANIDGYPTKIYYANHATQGIFVPAGEHRVNLSYRTIPSF